MQFANRADIPTLAPELGTVRSLWALFQGGKAAGIRGFGPASCGYYREA